MRICQVSNSRECLGCESHLRFLHCTAYSGGFCNATKSYALHFHSLVLLFFHPAFPIIRPLDAGTFPYLLPPCRRRCGFTRRHKGGLHRLHTKHGGRKIGVRHAHLGRFYRWKSEPPIHLRRKVVHQSLLLPSRKTSRLYLLP